MQEMIMWNLPVFVAVGLLAGTAARMLYPKRQPMQILKTLGLGVAGALVGGMISWAFWPNVTASFKPATSLYRLLAPLS